MEGSVLNARLGGNPCHAGNTRQCIVYQATHNRSAAEPDRWMTDLLLHSCHFGQLLWVLHAVVHVHLEPWSAQDE